MFKARVIVWADNNDGFPRSENKYGGALKTREPLGKLRNSGSNLHFFFLDVLDDERDDEVVNGLNGIIYMEVVSRHDVYELATKTVGALLCTCGVDRIKEVLNFGYVDYEWLKQDNEEYIGITPVYFTFEECLNFTADDSRLWANTNSSRPATPDTPSSSFYINRWDWYSFLEAAVDGIEDDITAGRKDPELSVALGEPVRELTRLEYLWLYFYIKFRTKVTLPNSLRVLALKMIRVPFEEPMEVNNADEEGGEMEMDDELDEICKLIVEVEHSDEDEWLKSIETAFMRNQNVYTWFVLNNHADIIPLIKAQYIELENRYYTGVEYCKRVPKKLEEAKRAYYTSRVYITAVIDELMEANSRSSPANMFDVEAMMAWSDERLAIIEEALHPDKIYGGVFEEARCVWTNDVFKLYGAIEDYLIPKMAGRPCIEGVETKDCTDPKYALVEMKTINNSVMATNRLPPPGCQYSEESLKLNFPYDKEQSATGKLYKYSSLSCIPNWCRWKDGKAPLYKCCVRDDANGSFTMREILENKLLGDGYSHETIQNGLHLSTLILDVDINPWSSDDMVDDKLIARDMVELVDRIMAKLLPGEKVTHYIYYSTPKKEAMKYGFHHHVVLPEDVVMTYNCANSIMAILNDVRGYYPRTLGIFCGNKDGGVYDPAVYAKGMGVKFHNLRAPEQSKPDKTRKLQLVYRTDGLSVEEPVEWRFKLAHAPKPFSIYEGRIMEKIEGVKLINNREFLNRVQGQQLSTYINKVHRFDVLEIMKGINTRCVLFSGEPTDCDKLLAIMNYLWEKQGKKKMRKVLLELKSENGSSYSKPRVDAVLKKSKVIVYNDKLLVATKKECFELCPHKIHKNCDVHARVCLSYNPGSVAVEATVSSFQNKSCNNARVNVTMLFDETYYTEAIKTYFTDVLLQHAEQADQTFVIKRNAKSGEPRLLLQPRTEDVASSEVAVFYALLEDLAVFRDLCGDVVMFSVDQNDRAVVVRAPDHQTFVDAFINENEYVSGPLMDSIVKLMVKDGYPVRV